MSIRTCLEDARVLSANGRQEGAFVQVLIAAAATSRLRYKRVEWDDGEAFKNFIHDEMAVISGQFKYGVTPPFQGKDTPLEEILYHYMRCQLVHEGEMPETIVFTQPEMRDSEVVHNMKLTKPFGFPAGWIERLATAVWLAAENDDLWHDEAEKRNQARKGLGGLCFDGLYCRRPGAETKKMKGRREKLSWTHDAKPFTLSFPPGTTSDQVAEALVQKANDIRNS